MTIKTKTLAAIRGLLGDVRSEYDGLVRQREQLLQQRENLLAAPLSKNDFIKLLEKTIDGYQGDYVDRFKQQLTDFHQKSDTLSAAVHLKNFPILAPWSGTTRIMPGAIFVLLGPTIKEALSKIISDLDDWPKDSGPSLVARKSQLKKIDADLGRVDSDLADLKAASDANGVVLSEFAGEKRLPGKISSKSRRLK